MNKTLYIIIGVVVAVVAAVLLVVSKDKKETGPLAQQEVVQNSRECKPISADQREVRVALEKDQIRSHTNTLVYRVLLDSLYPVNVAGIAFAFDQLSLKFISANFDSSVFPVQAPTDSTERGMKFNRGIVGEGVGLLGTGEFGAFTFERIGSAQSEEPTIDLESTDAFFNNGCAEKGRIVIK